MASRSTKRKERDDDASSSDVDEISPADVDQSPSLKKRKKPENYSWWIEGLKYALQTGDFKRIMEGFNGDSATKKDYLEFQEHVAMQIKPATVLFNQVDEAHPFISEFCMDPSKEKNTLLLWLKSIKEKISLSEKECDLMVSQVAGFWSEKRLDLNNFIVDHLWSLPPGAREKFTNPECADSPEAEKIVCDIAVKFAVTGGVKSQLKNFRAKNLQTLNAPDLLITFVKCRVELACQFDDKTLARKKIGDDLAVHGHIKASINVEKIGEKPPSSAKSQLKKGKKKVAESSKSKESQVNEGMEADAAESCQNINNTNSLVVRGASSLDDD